MTACSKPQMRPVVSGWELGPWFCRLSVPFHTRGGLKLTYEEAYLLDAEHIAKLYVVDYDK